MKTGVLLSANTNLALMDESGTLVIPDSVTAIGEGAFADLSGLKTIIIPGTVKEIRRNAFRNNADLETVILQEGVETIGIYAFMDCTSIKNVELPNSLLSIGTQAFYFCTSLLEITIPSNVKTINNHAFLGCTSLQRVKIEEGVQEIMYNAFDSCSNLTEINIPQSVIAIGTNVFTGCNSLADIDVAEGNQKYKYDSNSGMLMTADGSDILFISDAVLKQLTTFEIPEGITSFSINIESYDNITTLIIPDSLVSIGSSSFYPSSLENIIISDGNTSFTVENDCLYNIDKTTLILCFTKDSTVQIAETTTSIGDFAFYRATNLENVDFPASVTSIGSQLFSRYNTKLKNITIGANVSQINPLFKYNNYYGTVTIDSSNNYYTIDNNVLYNKDKTELITVLYEIQGEFIVDRSVTKIGDYAFHGQVNMASISLPSDLKEIGNSFNYCHGLTSIYIPNSVETIDYSAFSGANNLQQIQIDKAPGTIEGAPWGAMIGDRAIEWLRE